MVRIRILITAIVVMGALALPGAPAHANGYLVTKTADTMDFVCNADCSLREAIYEANNVQGPHSIDLPGEGAIYQLTIPGPGEDAGLAGDLDIFNDMEILGDANPIIEINGAALGDRVFHVGGNVAVISGVTIRGGYSPGGQGGGILNSGELYLYNSTVTGNSSTGYGGGIYTSGYLQINNSTVTGNTASSPPFGGAGGGVYAAPGSWLEVNGSTISGNGAGAVGGILNDGGTAFVNGSTVSGNSGSFAAGGIGSTGGLSVTNSIVNGNSSISGGGIWISGTVATITNTTVNGNYGGAGGGIYVYNGDLTVTSSTVSNNRGSDGGGMISASSSTTVTNSTISGNIANNGGGFYNDTDVASIVHSTISGNSATGQGGGIFISTGGMAIRDSIVANSPSGGNCGGFPPTSNDFNLSSDGTCSFLGKGDVEYTDPLLGPLVFNGGPTPTHALMQGSPAADAASVPCPNGYDPAADQRGVSRPQGFRCDIGAFEAPDSDSDGSSDPRDDDDDNDGFFDWSESPGCVLQAEDYDSFQDTDGCPDPDNDGDSICDAGQTSLSCTGSDSGKRCFDPAGTLSCPTTDCRNAAEDADAFKDSDGCPEPDNDNDSFPDVTDDCPGADASAGPNGMFGAAQDLNHNGVQDGAEAALTTDDVMPLLMWEDKDGVLDTDGCHDSPGADFDGDGFTDDAEVFTHLTDAGNPDTDADTVIDGTDNCPNWPNAAQNVPTWTIPANDSDCDGFTVAREQFVGTDPTKHCNVTTTTNDEPVDAWPSDFNDSRTTNLSDVILMGPSYNKNSTQVGYNQRFDLNASNSVNLSDVILLGPFYNKSCA